jgi:hypothetical protein
LLADLDVENELRKNCKTQAHCGGASAEVK